MNQRVNLPKSVKVVMANTRNPALRAAYKQGMIQAAIIAENMAKFRGKKES
jgi:hypothetical protein